MENSKQVTEHPLEILHIDTANSAQLFNGCETNKKYAANKFFVERLTAICGQHGGNVRNWEGEGGRAYFPVTYAHGNSVKAARQLLSELPDINRQTQEIVGKTFNRFIRIKIHYGIIRVAKEPGLDTSDRNVLDDFLKHEKLLAPHTNTLFVTRELFDQLDSEDAGLFEIYEENVVFGSSSTRLYKLITQTIVKKHHKAFDPLSNSNIIFSATDWAYISGRLQIQSAAVHARNFITNGLIEALIKHRSDDETPAISGELIFRLTLLNLKVYLQEYFSNNGSINFSICFWRLTKRNTQLQQIKYTDVSFKKIHSPRKNISVRDTKYMVCKCINSMEPIATPSVRSARAQKTWTDFDKAQSTPERGLESTLQIPVYCWEPSNPERKKNVTLSANKKIKFGVLSIDADAPDVFIVDEVSIWRDNLVGFLANLALAEAYRRFAD